jgi:hypothetical protein
MEALSREWAGRFTRFTIELARAGRGFSRDPIAEGAR